MNDTNAVSELFRPYNLSQLARDMSERGVPMSRNRLSQIARGQTAPGVRELPVMAEVMRVDFVELTRIFAGVAA